MPARRCAPWPSRPARSCCSRSAPGWSCASTASRCSGSSSTRASSTPSSCVNLAVLIYRLVAIVDAYRVAEYLNTSAASGAGQAGRARVPRNVVSIAGLLAVVLVMTGSHAVVARYDLLAKDVLDSGCIFISDESKECDLDASPSPGADRPAEPGCRPPCRPIRPNPRGPRPAARCPEVAIPPWDGKERLNILLIGADQRPNEGTFNTDTLIVVSIDPLTKQVAMFSLPRDTVDVPIPPGPARNAFGSVYRGKINGWWTNDPPSLRSLPGDQEDARLQRAQGHPRQPLQARHQVLRRGQLRRLPERSSTRWAGSPSTSRSRSRTTASRRPRAACGGSTSRAGSST